MAVGTRSRMSPSARRQRNREEMVEAIIASSREVMREDGVAALNLQEVARRVGIRAPSLYEYFASKMALYDALFLSGVELWGERVDNLLARRFRSPWKFLDALLATYVDFADDAPEMFKMIHERHVPGFEPSPQSLAQSVRLTRLGVDALKGWIDRGLIDPGLPPERAFDLVIVVLRGLAGGQIADNPGSRSKKSRFRRLIPAAVALFEASWEPRTSPAARKKHKGR